MRIKTFAAAIFLALYSNYAMAYSIWPVPREVTENNSMLDLSTPLTIVADESVDALTVERAEEVLTKAGLEYTVRNAPQPGTNSLYIGVSGATGPATQYATAHDVPMDVFSTEGYCYDPHVVSVDNDAIVIIGDSEGSAFYGLASLEQMLEQADGDKLPGAVVEDYAHTKYRGLVEGFYGHPWSMESRLNLLDYMKRYKMNYYVYGPKADPYHAGNWRGDYPESVTDHQRHMGQISAGDMEQLATHAAACKVDFVWAIHPTLGSYYVDLNWVDDIMTKFEQLHSLGVRHFGVSVDDMRGHPENQAQLPHLVQQAIDAKWNGENSPKEDNVGNVLFVPTCYALNYGATYSLTPIRDIDPKVEVGFTGYDCFSNVRASSFGQMADYIGRDPIFWWNNPVNDDHDTWLYLYGLTERWKIEQQNPVNHMRGFLLNPMNQGQASKVCIFQGADYCWNPAAFNERQSWEESLKSIVKTGENVAALKDFISVMSAYSTVETRTPEGEQYNYLYQNFQNEYSPTSAPESSELQQVMQKCYDACKVMRTFKDSEDEDIALFYTDIEPWLNKMEDMSLIVLRAIEFMGSSSSLDHWTEFSEILAKAENIHKNHVMSVLEGSGTSTSETFPEVMPTPVYLDPFIDFLAGILPNHAPQLPARSKNPAIITNLESASGVTLDTDADPASISGLEGKALKVGEYIGVCLNEITKVNITVPALPDGVVLEHSISGKEWQEWDGEECFMAYFRLRGEMDEAVELSFDKIPFSLPTVADSTVPSVETNMGQWEDYGTDNIIDDNTNTFFWSNGSQRAGQYITLDFKASNPRRNVTLTFNSGDQPTGTVEVQLSNDNSTWNTIASFTQADLINNAYICSANGEPARYVRFYIATATGASWLQLAEFAVSSVATATMATTHDNEEKEIFQLNDIALTTHYAASGNGFIEHLFIENLDIEQIEIYHNSHYTADSELPVIELYSNGEWHTAGTLQGERTVVNVPEEMRHVTKLRMSWSDGNAPDLYEIYPVGKEYVQPASDYTGIEGVENDAEESVSAAMSNGAVTVTAHKAMEHIEVSDISGRIIAVANPMSATATIPVSEKMVIVSVRLADGTTRTLKVK